MKHAKAESKIGFLNVENEEMKKEVHICKAMTKRVENSENLRKIGFRWPWRWPIKRKWSYGSSK